MGRKGKEKTFWGLGKGGGERKHGKEEKKKYKGGRYNGLVMAHQMPGTSWMPSGRL